MVVKIKQEIKKWERAGEKPEKIEFNIRRPDGSKVEDVSKLEETDKAETARKLQPWIEGLMFILFFSGIGFPLVP